LCGNKPQKYDDDDDDDNNDNDDGDDDDDDVLETLSQGMETHIVFTVVAIFM
jgi:hypothetical protein